MILWSVILRFTLLGVAPNLPTIPSASDFNTVLSSDQNTLDGTHSQHSTSQDDIAGVEEGNQGFPAVQLADAQVSILIVCVGIPWEGKHFCHKTKYYIRERLLCCTVVYSLIHVWAEVPREPCEVLPHAISKLGGGKGSWSTKCSELKGFMIN